MNNQLTGLDKTPVQEKLYYIGMPAFEELKDTVKPINEVLTPREMILFEELTIHKELREQLLYWQVIINKDGQDHLLDRAYIKFIIEHIAPTVNMPDRYWRVLTQGNEMSKLQYALRLLENFHQTSEDGLVKKYGVPAAVHRTTAPNESADKHDTITGAARQLADSIFSESTKTPETIADEIIRMDMRGAILTAEAIKSNPDYRQSVLDILQRKLDSLQEAAARRAVTSAIEILSSAA